MSYEPSKSPIMKLWNRFGNHNLGRFLVSKIVCLKAPLLFNYQARFYPDKAWSCSC